MADFHKMIPFILHSEEGLKPHLLNQTPVELYRLASSRGVHLSKYDKGGYTMCGVTLATYAEYRRKLGIHYTSVNDLRSMSYSEWVSILKGMFWDRWQADRINCQMVAAALVDWVWTSGRYGITNVQRLLGVIVDGIVGPKTLAAINEYPDQHELFNRIQDARKAFFISISPPGSNNIANRQGWLNRLAKITWSGFDYSAK